MILTNLNENVIEKFSGKAWPRHISITLRWRLHYVGLFFDLSEIVNIC